MSSTILLYHTGYQEIKTPDVRFGRKNADFGQGFYMTEDRGFAMRWARERRGFSTCVNTYEFDPSGLKIYRFNRDENWFDYILNNRAGRADTLPEADVITGPIANDTIYDTFGIITSGLLEKEQSFRMLAMGSAYEQTVIKSEKAVSQLKWLSCRMLKSMEIAKYRESVAMEEAEYQSALLKILETI